MQGRNWKSIGVWSCMMDTVCVTKVHTVYLYGNLSNSWFRNECNEFNIFSKLQNFVNFILWYGMWLNSEHFVYPNFCSISHNYKVIYFLKAKYIKEYKYKGEIKNSEIINTQIIYLKILLHVSKFTEEWLIKSK